MSIEPCPMCNRYDDDEKEQIELKELESEKMNLLLTGILFASKATDRQKEVFMAHYYMDRQTYVEIADDYGISKQAVADAIDRATSKIAIIYDNLRKTE